MIKYDLNNRVAVVTGGAQGFGLAITERFIEAGAKVVIWDIDESAAKDAINKLKSENLSHQAVDVTNFEIINQNLENFERDVVASKIADKCLIQLSYAIGVSKPLSIYVDLFDNDLDKNKFVVEKIKENFDLSPRGIREMLNLNKPIYEKTAAYGHFGRTPESDGSFSWEKTDKIGFFSK